MGDKMSKKEREQMIRTAKMLITLVEKDEPNSDLREAIYTLQAWL